MKKELTHTALILLRALLVSLLRNGPFMEVSLPQERPTHACIPSEECYIHVKDQTERRTGRRQNLKNKHN